MDDAALSADVLNIAALLTDRAFTHVARTDPKCVLRPTVRARATQRRPIGHEVAPYIATTVQLHRTAVGVLCTARFECRHQTSATGA